MPRQDVPQFSFNQGEVSKLALGRVDVAKLRLAAQCQVNWLPWALGPMMLRPGLQYVGEVLGDAVTRLLRFVFSKLDTALIELTPGIMRVWVNDALVTRAAVATTVSDPNFNTGTGWITSNSSPGVSVTIGGGEAQLLCPPVGGLASLEQALTISSADEPVEHGLRIVVVNGPVTFRIGSASFLGDVFPTTVLDTGTHCLAFTPVIAAVILQFESTDPWRKIVQSVSIDAAGVLQVPTPWGAGDLANIRDDQSGDVVFTASYGLAQYKIERHSTHSWSVVLYRSSNGPFQSAPKITANLTPTAFYGNGNLTSDRAYFQAGHVGCLFQLFTSGQSNEASLGANNAYTAAVRVSGVGATRNYSWAADLSVYSGVLSFQRSYDGPDTGFITVATAANGATGGLFNSATGGAAGTPDLDNIIAWERVGFEAGNYASGASIVHSTYNGNGGFGICRVTGYNSPTNVSIEVLQPFSSLNATTNWLEQDWSAVVGYPDCCAFFDGRLWWMGRDEFWGSQADNFVGFANQDALGNPLGDAGAMNEQFGSGPVDTVTWALGLTRLLAGREGAITSIRASAFDEVLTPTNISAKDCSPQGAARLPAVKVGMDGIYVDQSNRRVFRLAFNPQKLDYVTLDLTRLNLDIGKPGFVDVDYQVRPDGMGHFVLANGQSAALLDLPEEAIEAWWRIQTAGVIESVAVLPRAGLEDAVYFVVRRTINNVARRFIEKLATRDACVGGLANQQADCHLLYQGSPVTSVQASWLPSTTCVVWADGAAIGTATSDASGNFTMPDGLAHSNIVVGLGGAVVVGSTSSPLANQTQPDQIFAAPSNTLAVDPAYDGYPCEVFADLGQTGEPVHIGTLVPAGGFITLPNGALATVIIAVIGYAAPFESAKLAYAAQGGAALTRKKRIGHLGLVAYDINPAGVQFGQRFDALEPLPQYVADQAVPAGTVWSEYDQPMEGVAGNWNTDARLCLLAQAPNPCTIAAVVIDIA